MVEQYLHAWLRRHPLLAAMGVVIIPAAVAIGVGNRPGIDGDFKKGLYTGALTLVFGGLLGGLLKILLDNLSSIRLKRNDAATFVGNVLNDLKSVYDRVGRARIVIPAHQSVKTYGDEMRDLIQARVQLKNVIRALEGRKEGITKKTERVVKPAVEEIERYLAVLTEEFKNNYKVLSDHQRAYEMRVDAELKRLADSRSDDTPNITNSVWGKLNELPTLKDFIDGRDASTYQKEFEEPLGRASSQLRVQLAEILDGLNG